MRLLSSCSILIISQAELSSEYISSSFKFNNTQLEQQVFTLGIVSLTKIAERAESAGTVFAISVMHEAQYMNVSSTNLWSMDRAGGVLFPTSGPEES